MGEWAFKPMRSGAFGHGTGTTRRSDDHHEPVVQSGKTERDRAGDPARAESDGKAGGADRGRSDVGSERDSALATMTAEPSTGRADLDRAVETADAMIALIRGIPEYGGGRGDTSGLVVFGAFRRGFRRFVQIRELANAGAGPEAAILARTLLSLVARAMYVDAPDDPAVRKERWDRLLKRQRQDELAGFDLLKAANFDVTGNDDEIAAVQAELDALEARGVKNLPSDRQLSESLEMHAFYARIYAPASELVHFSLAFGIGDLLGVESTTLEAPDWERSAQALEMAIITFGLFVVEAEKSMQHGIGERIREIADNHFGKR
jgi:hypothetical protein